MCVWFLALYKTGLETNATIERLINVNINRRNDDPRNTP